MFPSSGARPIPIPATHRTPQSRPMSFLGGWRKRRTSQFPAAGRPAAGRLGWFGRVAHGNSLQFLRQVPDGGCGLRDVNRCFPWPSGAALCHAMDEARFRCAGLSERLRARPPGAGRLRPSSVRVARGCQTKSARSSPALLRRRERRASLGRRSAAPTRRRRPAGMPVVQGPGRQPTLSSLPTRPDAGRPEPPGSAALPRCPPLGRDALRARP